MNKVILMGNLTRDPELRFLENQNNTAVVNFGIAMNERWTDAQSGEQRENVTFVEVEAWNRQAEVVNEYFKKGMQILVEGSLKFEQWVDQASGQNRNRLKVRLQRFEFTGPRLDENGNAVNSNGNSNSNGNANRNGNGNAATAAPAPTTGQATSNDDVPF